MGTFGGTPWGGVSPGSSSGVAVSDLIYHALRLAGVTLGPERVPSADQYADGLRVFNRFTGVLNTRARAIYTKRIDLWPTSAQQQAYTLGPGGNWDGPRPQRITQANLLLNTGPVIRRPLRLWDDKEWASIRLQAISTYPYGLYNDGAAPLATISFHPVPDNIYQIELYTWQALPKAVTIADLLIYPDGYEEMLVTNLAVRLALMFQKQVHPDVRQQAINSLAAVTAMNTEVPKLKGEGTGGLYNWLSGLVEP